MLTTNRADLAERIDVSALHGMSVDAWKRFSDQGYRHYDVVEAGFKYNMTDLQAAIGIHQLARVESNWERREAIWKRYQEAFAGLPVTRPADPDPATRHGYHLYTLLVDEDTAGLSRDGFLSAIQAQNIGAGVHYLSIPEHDYYRDTYGWTPEAYPNAMRVGRQTVSLPFSAKLSDGDVDDVIAGVRRVLGRS